MDFFSAAVTLWYMAALYWFISAFNVKRTKRSEISFSRILYILIWLAAFYMMFDRNMPFGFLYQTIFLQQTSWKIVGLICNVAGLAYAVWARATLGKNWSGQVTIKEDHELIQSGPYRLTRHPIYSGMLLAFCGLAFIAGQVHSYLAIPILLTGMMIKILQEEKFMLEAFGDQYILYSHRVKRLVPFLF